MQNFHNIGIKKVRNLMEISDLNNKRKYDYIISSAQVAKFHELAMLDGMARLIERFDQKINSKMSRKQQGQPCDTLKKNPILSRAFNEAVDVALRKQNVDTRDVAAVKAALPKVLAQKEFYRDVQTASEKQLAGASVVFWSEDANAIACVVAWSPRMEEFCRAGHFDTYAAAKGSASFKVVITPDGGLQSTHRVRVQRGYEEAMDRAEMSNAAWLKMIVGAGIRLTKHLSEALVQTSLQGQADMASAFDTYNKEVQLEVCGKGGIQHIARHEMIGQDGATYVEVTSAFVPQTLVPPREKKTTPTANTQKPRRDEPVRTMVAEDAWLF